MHSYVRNKTNLIWLNYTCVWIWKNLYVTQYTHNINDSTNPTYIQNQRSNYNKKNIYKKNLFILYKLYEDSKHINK